MLPAVGSRQLHRVAVSHTVLVQLHGDGFRAITLGVIQPFFDHCKTTNRVCYGEVVPILGNRHTVLICFQLPNCVFMAGRQAIHIHRRPVLITRGIYLLPDSDWIAIGLPILINLYSNIIWMLNGAIVIPDLRQTNGNIRRLLFAADFDGTVTADATTIKGIISGNDNRSQFHGSFYFCVRFTQRVSITFVPIVVNTTQCCITDQLYRTAQTQLRAVCSGF